MPSAEPLPAAESSSGENGENSEKAETSDVIMQDAPAVPTASEAPSGTIAEFQAEDGNTDKNTAESAEKLKESTEFIEIQSKEVRKSEPQPLPFQAAQPLSQPPSLPLPQSSKNAPKLLNVRFTRLRELVTRALDKSVEYLTFDKLAQCYPTLASTPAGINELRQALNQILTYWKASCEREFDAIFTERHLEEKLNELDGLVMEANQRKHDGELGFHFDTLTPQQILRLRLYKQKSDLRAELAERVAFLEVENAKRAAELAGIRRKGAEAANEIRNVVLPELGRINAVADRLVGGVGGVGSSGLDQKKYIEVLSVLKEL